MQIRNLHTNKPNSLQIVIQYSMYFLFQMYIGPYRPPRSMTSTVEDTRDLRVGHLVAVLCTDCILPAIGEVLQLRHEEIEVKWLEGTYNST